MKKFFLITCLFQFCLVLPVSYGQEDLFDPLPPLVFSAETSILQGVVKDPLLRGDTLSVFYGTVTSYKDEHCVVDESGHFRFELCIGYPTEVRMGFTSRRGDRVSVFLPPGETTEVTIENNSNKLFYQYSGSWSRVNNEFANRAIHASLLPFVMTLDEVPSVKNVESFRTYLHDNYLRIVKGIEAREDLSPVTKKLLIMQRVIELYSFLKDAPYHLATAGIFPENTIISSQLPKDYFHPLSGLPSLGDPRFLYCLQYGYLVEQMRVTLPLFVDDSLHMEMYQDGRISSSDLILLSRLTDLSNSNSVEEFTGEEKNRLYECLRETEQYKMDCENRYWSTIFGEDLSFIHEYWEALRFVEKIRNFSLLSEDEKTSVAKWSHEAFRKQVLAYDHAMDWKKNRGLRDEIRTDQKTGKVRNEDLFLSFYKKHQGNPVLLVFWETWLATDGNTLKTLQPLKEELERRGMKVVAIASENSPEREWKKMINDEFSGRHIRVSRDQMRYLRNEYFIGNLPVFFLIDKEGIILRRFTDVSLVQELLRKAP